MTNAESQQDNGATSGAKQPQITLQRIYIKDISFESPNSPHVFAQQWQPKVGVELNTKAHTLANHLHEIVLHVTVTAKLDEQVAYLAEVQQAGVFLIKDLADESMAHALKAFCPNILFPYAREAVDSLVQKGSFPALLLTPVNFDALYAQRKEQAEEVQKQPPEQIH